MVWFNLNCSIVITALLSLLSHALLSKQMKGRVDEQTDTDPHLDNDASELVILKELGRLY